ncbi:MAG: alpha/beta hydrolase family protein [Gemmataceae bacterium]
MKRITLLVLVLALLAGCRKARNSGSLVDARKGFRSELISLAPPAKPAPQPPTGVFRLLRYPAAGGQFAAYLSPDPDDGAKHAAMLWITGGDCNSIDDGCWTEQSASNDQSASAFRKAGMVMMFPSLRGGNDNPGQREGLLGEVDDVLAAADFLAQQNYVDPNRIYLGGHSTGGSLALLVAECSDRFRAVFSFGPVDDVSGYPAVYAPFSRKNRKEVELRSPGRWLHTIKTPTFVLEGTIEGNITSLRNMAKSCTNANVHFIPGNGVDHFSILAPATKVISQKIKGDTGPTCAISITEGEITP